MVDLRSDTQTLPCAEMRRAMADAEVGDEQRGEDPTVAELERRVAELTGKDGGVFLPSGTLCNIVAFFVYCRPGDAVVLDRASHPATAEQGGPAVHARVVLRKLAGERGVFTASQLELVLERPDGYDRRYREPVRLISVENTHNFGMGKCGPEKYSRACATSPLTMGSAYIWTAPDC
jgi:threonine aldolase